MISNQPLPAMPARIAKLPRDHRGFPVPWFVQWFEDGKPGDYGKGQSDFRVVDSRKIGQAVKQRLCWVCGEPTGIFKAFVIGPMCAVNRVISEPPSHRECAIFSAIACPFLSRPRMKRNEKDLPEEGKEAAGFVIKRNPGVACVWVTKSFRPFRPQVGNIGVLFHLGEPVEVLWFSQSRPATREEVLASIESGYPLLAEMAEKDGRDGIRALVQARQRAMPLLPPESAVAAS